MSTFVYAAQAWAAVIAGVAFAGGGAKVSPTVGSIVIVVGASATGFVAVYFTVPQPISPVLAAINADAAQRETLRVMPMAVRVPIMVKADLSDTRTNDLFDSYPRCLEVADI